MSKIKEPLKTVLRKYFHIESYDSQFLRNVMNTGESLPYDIALFKAQLREAIDMKLISPEEYENLTEEDFDSQDDLQCWLEVI